MMTGQLAPLSRRGCISRTSSLQVPADGTQSSLERHFAYVLGCTMSISAFTFQDMDSLGLYSEDGMWMQQCVMGRSPRALHSLPGAEYHRMGFERVLVTLTGP